MMYLDAEQITVLKRVLQTFFSLPYSTDLDGKDVETILGLVKSTNGRKSRRKELFDIVDGDVGYSVKTLSKSPKSVRVDLQEQRFCDVKQLRDLIATGGGDPASQGKILLSYMKSRIADQMEARFVKTAKSLILLKYWDEKRENFSFRYWEEDFYNYIVKLVERNAAGEIEWVQQEAGLHGRDRTRQDKSGKNLRLLRMHYKHNQIFTDHDIPFDAVKIDFTASRLDWEKVANLISAGIFLPEKVQETAGLRTSA